VSNFNNKISGFSPPHVLIAGEIRTDLRYKAKTPDSGNFNIVDGSISGQNLIGITGLSSGEYGYSLSDFPESGAPRNLNESGYYEIKTSTVGMWDSESFSSMINNSFTDENSESQYDIGAISLDGLFVPYTTASGGNSLLPHFEYVSETASGDIDSRTLNPFNPLNKIPESGIESGFVGSGYPSGIEGYWLKYGHNIALSLSSDFLAEDGLHDFNFEEDYNYRGRVESTGIRSIAHRSPLVLSGWGYDLNGNPVPSSGNDFHPDMFWDSKLWKTGPVDLRWDDTRKVWSASGGGAEIIKFTISGPGPAVGDSSAPCDYALGTVDQIGCNTVSAQVGQTGVRLYDDDLCYLNLPLHVLTGLKGTAEKFDNIHSASGQTECLAAGFSEEACRWVITGICCGEEIE